MHLLLLKRCAIGDEKEGTLWTGGGGGGASNQRPTKNDSNFAGAARLPRHLLF